MNVRKNFFLTALVIGASFIPLEKGHAQDKFEVEKVDVDGIEIDFPLSPDYNYTGTVKRFTQREWLEVEVEFEVEGKSTDDHIPELTFIYYIFIEDGKKGRLLKGEIDHINIEVDTKLHSVAYISPTTLKRLTGKDKPSKGDIKAISVEVRFQGKTLGGATEFASVKGRWWEKFQQEQGLVHNKTQTPFAPLFWDRYPDIKSEE